MKCLSLKMVWIFRRTVYGIPQKRMAKACHMNANLMGTSGFQSAFNISGVTETFQNLIMCYCFFSVFVVDSHLFTVCRVTSYGSIYSSLIFFQIALYNGAIASVDTMDFQLFRKIPVDSIVFTDQKCTGGILVDTVDNSWTENTVEAVMNTTHDLHVIRDATRGGVGTVLYEIAGQSNVGIRLDAAKVPVAPEVKGVCGMLGLEPLYLACEGRMVIMAPMEEAEKIVETLKKCPYSKDAAIIGEVTADQPGKVVMTTEIGTQALLPQPGGELLPRIC